VKTLIDNIISRNKNEFIIIVQSDHGFHSYIYLNYESNRNKDNTRADVEHR